MNPITHGAISWLIAQPLPDRRDRVFVTLAGLAPDADAYGYFGNTDTFFRVHHTFGHNLFAAGALALAAPLVCKSRLKSVLLAFSAVSAHLLCDLFGSGSEWGIPFFWPLDRRELMFSKPFSWELVSWQNVTITILCFVAIGWIGRKKRRTIAELISPKVDAAVIATFEKWFRALPRHS